MLSNCISLKSIDFPSYKINNAIIWAQYSLIVLLCYQMIQNNNDLIEQDLSSFNINNVADIGPIFSNCFSIKKENIKINNKNHKLLNEIKK